MNKKYISIEKLVVNSENPRFEPVKNQQAAMDLMLNEVGKEVLNLAEDIAKHGLNPSKSLMVVEIEKDHFLPLEGNRRVVALKLLHNPELATDKKIVESFKTLKKEHGTQIPTQVECSIFPDKESAFRWVNLEHTGKNKDLKFYNKLDKAVCIQKVTPGFNPKIISQLIKLGYKGIILEGYGAGNVPINENSLVPEIKKATEQGIPIIMCTQCAIGYAWVYLYEVGRKALEAGAIPGHDMISETALTKLMWIIGNRPNYTIKEIKKLFLKDLSGEVSDIRTPKEKRIWEYAL